jgi:hypothetical protein
VKFERRSGGQENLENYKTYSLKEKVLTGETGSINFDRLLENTDKYSDFRIGSVGYSEEIDTMYKDLSKSSNVGSGIADNTSDFLGDDIGRYVQEVEADNKVRSKLMDFIIDDTIAHEHELEKIKNRDNQKFKRYYQKINQIVGNMTEINEKIHYFRNKLNVAPETLEDMVKEAQKGNWRLLPPIQAAFHMNDHDKIDEPLKNLKFVSSDGYFEAVYDVNGKLLTEENDPINMGTYNYIGPDDVKGHERLDVDPYYKWGNTEEVEGRGMRRELAAATNNLRKYESSKEAQLHSYRIRKEINPEKYEKIEERVNDLDINY